MRYGFILPILASALLTGCFPRLAHYDGDAPAPAPQAQASATPMPVQPAAGPVLAEVVPEDRIFAFIVLTNPFLTPAMARQAREAPGEQDGGQNG